MAKRNTYSFFIATFIIGTVVLSIFVLTKSISQTKNTQVTQAIGNIYYVSSNSGNDVNNGTSESTPWKSLSKVNSFPFQPGDSIYFQRGSVFSGGLIISKSGASQLPLTIGAYGTGTNPIFENPGTSGNHTNSIRINGSYVILENLITQNAYYSGVYIDQNSGNNIIKNIEVRNAGIGIAVNGKNNLITNNFIHDLKMVVNDSGGNGNDYGAVGIEIFNGPNEVSYNKLVKCVAPSYDFGTDGGALEIYLLYGNADGSSFHHNYAEQTDGFIEIHSRDKLFSANNISIYQNVIVNLRAFFDIGMPGYGGGHAVSAVNNLKIEQNTYVAPASSTPGEQLSVFYFHEIAPTANQIFIRNNIIYSMNSWGISPANAKGTFTHKNNIFYISSGRSIGFTLDVSEKQIDPQFVDLERKDFHLKSTSPAIDSGVNLGYSSDFEGKKMPIGTNPDIGAYEFGISGTTYTPTLSSIRQGDINTDGIVNILDFQLLSNSFGKSSGQTGFNPNADLNKDNLVNILDFQILSNNFGK